MRRRTVQADGSGTGEEQSPLALPGAQDGTDTAQVGSDYLDYLSDMVLELKVMAERADTPTLAGLLDLAYREAQLQRDQRRAD